MRNAETVVGLQRERHGAHETVTGEPVAGTTGTAGSGRGPLEKMTCMREGDPLSSAHAWCAVISFQEHEEASRCLS